MDKTNSIMVTDNTLLRGARIETLHNTVLSKTFYSGSDMRTEIDELKFRVENLERGVNVLLQENKALKTELQYHPDGKYILETVKTRFETGDYSNVEKVLAEK